MRKPTAQDTEQAVDLANVEIRLNGKIEDFRKEVRAEIGSFRKEVDQRFEDVMTALREIKERLP